MFPFMCFCDISVFFALWFDLWKTIFRKNLWRVSWTGFFYYLFSFCCGGGWTFRRVLIRRSRRTLILTLLLLIYVFYLITETIQLSRFVFMYWEKFFIVLLLGRIFNIFSPISQASWYCWLRTCVKNWITVELPTALKRDRRNGSKQSFGTAGWLWARKVRIFSKTLFF